MLALAVVEAAPCTLSVLYLMSSATATSPL